MPWALEAGRESRGSLRVRLNSGCYYIHYSRRCRPAARMAWHTASARREQGRAGGREEVCSAERLGDSARLGGCGSLRDTARQVASRSACVRFAHHHPSPGDDQGVRDQSTLRSLRRAHRSHGERTLYLDPHVLSNPPQEPHAPAWPHLVGNPSQHVQLVRLLKTTGKHLSR